MNDRLARLAATPATGTGEYRGAVPTRARRIRAAVVDAVAGADTVEKVMFAAEAVLRPAVGASAGAWSTVDPASHLGTSCVVIGAPDGEQVRLPDDPARERQVFEVEWEDRQPNTFGALARQRRPVAALRLDVAEPREVPRFRRLLEPLGVTDEVRVRFTAGEAMWGTAILYRTVAEPYAVADVEVLAASAPVVAAALRRAMLATAMVAEHRTIPEPPGALLLGADDGLLVTSPAAENLLGLLGEDHARTALTSVAAACRAHGARSLRATGRGGSVMLHASPAKGVADGVSVVVERPRPVELAELIVEALGLTPRERQVTELMLQGRARADIAHRLGTTPDTVADQIGSIYAKAHVPGRSELCAMLFGEFYRPRIQEGIPPGPYGFFLDAT